MWVTSLPSTALVPTSIALGNFDGIHRGHRRVIDPILEFYSNQGSNFDGITNSSEPRTLPRPYPTVATFDPHPQEFFSGQPRLALTPTAEKARLLCDLGIDQLVLIPFTPSLARATPHDFVESVLVGQLQAKMVSVGENFRFGRDRAGTAQDLQVIARKFGIATTIVTLEHCGEERISSSTIRTYLSQGDIAAANRLLGRPYTLFGRVTRGQQLGRTLGFPTANLQLSPNKFLPRFGVYAVRVELETGELISGVANIGNRPTVSGDRPTVEIHLLDWSGDLYDVKMTAYCLQFLRPERRFESLDALKNQIAQDCKLARRWLGVTLT